MRTLVCVLGPTNCGKTTLITKLEQIAPTFKGVFVGKMLREKYPPEYFEGAAAPEKTRNEALRMMIFESLAAWSAGRIPVLDGQPRESVQSQFIELDWEAQGVQVIYIHAYAPKFLRDQRAESRDSDPKGVELSKSRSVTDAAYLYDQLEVLRERSARLITLRTDDEAEIRKAATSICQLLSVETIPESGSPR